MPVETLVDKTECLAGALVSRVEEAAREALSRHGRFTLALPGGSVAASFFPELSRASVDWTRTDFFWGDERAVPPDHPDSNYGVARSLWLGPARVPEARIHRMVGEAANLEAEADAHAKVLERIAGAPPRLDLVLLGVGPDGHVCSLFAGHPVLAERSRWVAAVEDSPKPPPRRLTMTMPVLTAAGTVIVVALGRGKADVVRAAIEDPESPLPVAIMAREARRTVFLLDPEAARLLRPR
jgi:6-phosphogluconolactonase